MIKKYKLYRYEIYIFRTKIITEYVLTFNIDDSNDLIYSLCREEFGKCFSYESKLIKSMNKKEAKVLYDKGEYRNRPIIILNDTEDELYG